VAVRHGDEVAWALTIYCVVCFAVIVVMIPVDVYEFIQFLREVRKR